MKYFSGQWPTENNAPITLAEQLVKTRFVFWNPKNGSNCYSLSRDFLWNIKCVTIFKYIYFFIMENLYYKESTSLSCEFCVRRPCQNNTICWELNLISAFFAFFLSSVWADGINKYGRCLVAGGRGCWLKGLHQIPSVSWDISSFLTFPHLLDCFLCTRNSVSILCIVIMNDGRMG